MNKRYIVNLKNTIIAILMLLLLFLPFINTFHPVYLAMFVLSGLIIHALLSGRKITSPATRHLISRFSKSSIIHTALIACIFIMQYLWIRPERPVQAFILFFQVFISIFIILFFSKMCANIELIVQIICAFLLLFSAYYLGWILVNGLPSGRNSVFSFVSSNFCAAIMYLSQPLLLYYLYKSKKQTHKKTRICCYLSIILSIIIVLLSGSRTALGVVLAILAIPALFLKVNIKNRLKIIVLCILALIVLIIAYHRVPALQQLIQRAADIFTGLSTVKEDGRILFWTIAWSNFTSGNLLLGSGSNFIDIAYTSSTVNSAAHNLFIEILLFGGIATLVLYLVHVIGILLKGFVGATSSQKVFLLATFAGYFITAVFQPFFTTSFICGFLVWITYLTIVYDPQIK